MHIHIQVSPDLFLKRSSLIMPASSSAYLQKVLGEEFMQYRENANNQLVDVLESRGVEIDQSILLE